MDISPQIELDAFRKRAAEPETATSPRETSPSAATFDRQWMETPVYGLLAYARAMSRGIVSRELVGTERILKDVRADMQSTIEHAGTRIHFAELPPCSWNRCISITLPEIS